MGFLLRVDYPLDALDAHLQKENPSFLDDVSPQKATLMVKGEPVLNIDIGEIHRIQAWGKLDKAIADAAGQTRYDSGCDIGSWGDDPLAEDVRLRSLYFHYTDEMPAYTAQRAIRKLTKQSPFIDLGIEMNTEMTESEN